MAGAAIAAIGGWQTIVPLAIQVAEKVITVKKSGSIKRPLAGEIVKAAFDALVAGGKTEVRPSEQELGAAIDQAVLQANQRGGVLAGDASDAKLLLVRGVVVQELSI